MGLRYEPASEPLHISAKQLFSNSEPQGATQANRIEWRFRDLYRNEGRAALSAGCASPIPVQIPKTQLYYVCLGSLVRNGAVPFA